MCRTATIFLFTLALAAAAVSMAVRHRTLARTFEPASAASGADAAADSPDVATALRSLSNTGGRAGVADQKPWAVRFAQYVNDHPGRQWVVGRAPRPCLSEQEAAEAAHADAAEKVYPVLLRQLDGRRRDAQWLRDAMQRDVAEGRLDADRFAEQFDRPYGKVWAESVLLDVSPERLDPLLAQYRIRLRAHHLQVRRHVTIAAALTTVTLLAYLLINSLTKGYFTTRLRVATTAIIAVAAVILLL